MKISKSAIFASAAGFGATVLALIGCSFVSTNPATTITNAVKASVPISITDAPGDEVLAASRCAGGRAGPRDRQLNIPDLN